MIEVPLEQVQEWRIPIEVADFEDRFRYSKAVEASFLEFDATDLWLLENVGDRETAWDFYFYGKDGYDYGCAKYFFLEEMHLRVFEI
jgi:hypothetical protein